MTATSRTRASELIEDFMIAVNTCTAQFLESRGFSSLRRIVRMPERWLRIVTLAAETGTQLPPAPDGRALEQWLLAQRRSDPDRFTDLSLSVVKLLGRGEYVVERPNEPTPDHFGLAVDDYGHSTAPNRRFADLVTQRLIKAALMRRDPPYTHDELAPIAARCMEREDAANRVERQVRKAAAAMMLQRRIGEVFDAVVTGVSPKGTWVRVRRPIVEGRLERGQLSGGGRSWYGSTADPRGSTEGIYRLRDRVVSGFSRDLRRSRPPTPTSVTQSRPGGTGMRRATARL